MGSWIKLIPHPDFPGPAGIEVHAQLERLSSSAVQVDFELHGDLRKVTFPAPQPRGRRDELWYHTCFEFFARGEGMSYTEFNFSPSEEWAAYNFDDYRTGMTLRQVKEEPRICCINDPEDAFILLATADLSGGSWTRASLTAVLEHMDGTKSYWALAHPPGKPDFHDPACFTLQLPPA